MNAFLAVVFFCIGECYFWSSNKLHATEADCQKAVTTFVQAVKEQGVESRWQCIRVPLTGV